MAFEPVSSPIKVVTKRKTFVGTSAGGGVIFEGRTDGDDVLTCNYSGGTLRIVRTMDASGKRSNTLAAVDEAGRDLARIDTQSRVWDLRLPSGESFPVSGGRARLTGYSSAVGDFASAKAPYLAPQRYVTLTLTDAFLQRPDRDVLAVIVAWAAEDRISSAISTNQVAS